jgi:hypothetical protein
VLFRSSRGFIAYVNLAIVICPLAVLTAGVGAFFGEWIAVTIWDVPALGPGAGVGAAVGLVLLGVWVITFVVRAGAPKMDPVAYGKKVACFIEDMKSRGVSPNSAFPPTFRMAVMLGFQVAPPQFLSAGGSFLWGVGLLGAIGATAVALFWKLQTPAVPVAVMAVITLILFTVLFGLAAIGTLLFRKQARTYGLPTWDLYSSQDSV